MKAESLLKQSLAGKLVPLEVLAVAYEVTMRRLRDVDDLIDSPDDQNWELVNDEEWSFLCSDWSTESLAGLHTKTWYHSQANLERLPELILDLLPKLKEKCPQYSLNGEKSAWIIKPASLSKGRGISCHNDLETMLKVLKQREGNWVVQKYIENPMILMRKKFDIRQWVLVTDWNPLTVWFYERCYLRFGVEDYSLENFSNKYVHLTNFSVSVNSQHFEEADIEGCMMHSEDFAEYLQQQHGRDAWETELKPKIKKIVMNCLECAQDVIENRKNSSELYGFDLMIAEDLSPWLIEVQASPSMDYSTDVTTELVQEVLEDSVKVMVDYAIARKKSLVDTGNFTLLYKAKRTVERSPNALGLNLVCEGKAMRR